MAWVAVDKNGTECISSTKPYRRTYIENIFFGSCAIELPKGSIKKLIGRNLTLKDDPVLLENL